MEFKSEFLFLETGKEKSDPGNDDLAGLILKGRPKCTNGEICSLFKRVGRRKGF